MPMIDGQPIKEKAAAAGATPRQIDEEELHGPLIPLTLAQVEGAPQETYFIRDGGIVEGWRSYWKTRQDTTQSEQPKPVGEPIIQPAQPDQKNEPQIGRRAARKPATPPSDTQMSTTSVTDTPTVPVVWDLLDGNEIVVKERPASELKPAVHNPPFSRRRDVERRVAGPGSKAGGKSKERRRSTDR